MTDGATTWEDLAGRRVGVWGLGAEGRASVARLGAVGAEVIVVDEHPHAASAAIDPALLPPEGVRAADDAAMTALGSCDAVVKSPGISRYRPEVAHLVDQGVEVLGGLGLWLAGVDRSRVVCVTGTKGKSTTVAVMAHLANGLGVRAVACGNLGLVPWSPDTPQDVDLWVVEASSYQVTDFEVAPPVVAVTSLSPDHLPWHGDRPTYYRDKLSLCTLPGVRVCVASATSPEVVAHADDLGPNVRWVDEHTWPGPWAEALGLRGVHNTVNAAIARTCLNELGVVGADDDARVAEAAGGFAGLESRLETVAWHDGVEFVDDGLSTNVLPTLAAIDTFAGRRLAVIVGGADRDVDLTPLAVALAARPEPTLVLTAYTTGPAIESALRDEIAQRSGTTDPSTTEVRACDDLDEAVTVGADWARPDGVVLLSPAAASFDAFTDYRHRSATFRRAISALA